MWASFGATHFQMSLDHDLLISSITGKGQEDKFSLHDSGEDDETKQGCLKKKKKE